MTTLIYDIRSGFRLLLAHPGVPLVVVITMALGIGANTALFSVVNAVLLRPLPYPDADRLMMVQETAHRQGTDRLDAAPANFLDWRAQNRVFERCAAFRYWGYTLTGHGEAERLTGMRVSADFFQTLGVSPLAGRVFSSGDDEATAPAVALVSYGLWQRRYGGAPDLPGEAITLDGRPYTVIGVLPSDFRFSDRAVDVWVPLIFAPWEIKNRNSGWMRVVARLKPEATLTQAQADMELIARRLAERYPDTNIDRGIRVVPLHTDLVGEAGPTVWMLFGMAGVVLLIACANVTNVLLAHALSRSHEFAVRLALGAGQGRILRQCLIESLLLAIPGGGGGLALAFWGVSSFQAYLPSMVPRAEAITMDGAVLGFSLALSAGVGIVCGVLPAWQALHQPPQAPLREHGPTTTGVRRRYIQNGLVVTQVALMVMLLTGAGLLITSLWRLQRVDPGFNPDRLLTLSISLPDQRYAQPQEKTAFFRQLIERTASLPGVASVGMVSHLPLLGGNLTAEITVDSRPPQAPGEKTAVNFREISPSFFRVMQIPLLQGRVFTEQDVMGTLPVVVNRAMVQRLWPGEDPVGQRITTGMDDTTREIVGVVGDIRHTGLASAPVPEIYVPYSQSPWPTMTVLVRTTTDPTMLVAAVRGVVSGIDRDQPVTRITTMEDIRSASIAPQRVRSMLLGAFAGVALILAGVGIYGVLAFLVSQRVREIGIRLALGGRPHDVLRLIAGHGLKLALTGVGIGLACSLALTRLMTGWLYGISATDPVTFGGVAILVLMVALFAAALPARRAALTDPVTALRHG